MLSTAVEKMLDIQYSVVSIRLGSAEQNGQLRETAFSKQAMPSLENILHSSKIPSKAGISNNVSKTKTQEVNFRAGPCASVLDNSLCERKYPLIQHQKTLTGNKLFKCIICHETFSNEFTLYRHKQLHGKNNSLLLELSSSICEKRPQPTQISKKSDYSNDASRPGKQRENSAGKSYRCDQCGKNFRKKYTLKRHQGLHTEGQTAQCTVCDKVLVDNGSLKRHMLVHSGERPYECDVCKKTFSTKGNLKAHSRIHSGEKHFPCELCGKEFSSMSDLKRHRRIHTGEKPFSCEICNKAFRKSSHLQTHVLIHTREKPYECEICLRRFSQSGHLRTHILIHTGQKSFECEMCMKRFALSSHLRRHILSHSR